jgi:23S rRNA (uracil1939-C5)-methyltransferase
MKRNKIFTGIEITGIADKGYGVGRNEEGKVFFVETAVPGDVVDVRARKFKKGTAFCTIEAFQKRSEKRIKPFCSHFELCGGCKWQHFPYEDQLKEKQRHVENAIIRIGKVNPDIILPICGAERTKYYRNKLEFTFSDSRWITEEEIQSGLEIDDRNAVGFHKPGTFDKIIDIENCYLQEEPSNAIRNFLRAFALEHGISFYNVRKHSGFLRNVIIRTSTTAEVMVILIVNKDDRNRISMVLDALIAEFPGITSLYFVINEKHNSSFSDLPMHHYSGKKGIRELLGHIQYEIGPKSFFQTNTYQAKRLYDITREFAGLSGNEVVYDLYTGLGSIALYLADQCKHVVGIEEISEAIEFSKMNQELNGIENTSFFCFGCERSFE